MPNPAVAAAAELSAAPDPQSTSRACVDKPEAHGNLAILPEREVGGRSGPDPTRFGDWEKNGRCIDF